MPQWLGYAADGTGYSIGLRELHLPKGEDPETDLTLMLSKCEYDRERFEEVVAQTLTEVVTRFEKSVRAHSVGPEVFSALLTHAANLALRRVALLVPGFKNAAFADEEECDASIKRHALHLNVEALAVVMCPGTPDPCPKAFIAYADANLIGDIARSFAARIVVVVFFRHKKFLSLFEATPIAA